MIIEGYNIDAIVWQTQLVRVCRLISGEQTDVVSNSYATYCSVGPSLSKTGKDLCIHLVVKNVELIISYLLYWVKCNLKFSAYLGSINISREKFLHGSRSEPQISCFPYKHICIWFPYVHVGWQFPFRQT